MLLILSSFHIILTNLLLNFVSTSGNLCVFCFHINLHVSTKTEFKSGLGIPAELFYLRAELQTKVLSVNMNSLQHKL